MTPAQIAELTDEDIRDYLEPLPEPEPENNSPVILRIKALKARGWTSEQINALFRKEHEAKKDKHNARRPRPSRQRLYRNPGPQ